MMLFSPPSRLIAARQPARTHSPNPPEKTGHPSLSPPAQLQERPLSPPLHTGLGACFLSCMYSHCLTNHVLSGSHAFFLCSSFLLPFTLYLALVPLWRLACAPRWPVYFQVNYPLCHNCFRYTCNPLFWSFRLKMRPLHPSDPWNSSTDRVFTPVWSIFKSTNSYLKNKTNKKIKKNFWARMH